MARRGSTGRAAVVYLLLAALQRGISILILPLITFVMSPEEYGAASLLTATSLLLTTIFAAPLEQLVFRSAAREDENSPSLTRIVGIYCYLCLPLVALPIAGATLLWVDEFLGVPGDVWAIEVAAASLIPAASYFALPYVRARHDIMRFIWVAGSSIVIAGTAKLILVVVWQMGVLGWALSDLLSAAAAATISMFLVRLPAARVRRHDILATVSFAVPLIPHRAAFWALSSLSRPAMALVSTLTQVGFLAFGLGLASVANMVLAEINRAVLPDYSRESFPAPGDRTREISRLQLLLALVVPSSVGVGVALLGRTLFADSYWPAFGLTGALLLGQAAYGLYLIPMNYLVQTAGRTRWSSIASAGGAALVLLFIVFFGREFEALGVAWATSMGYVVMAIVALAIVRRLGLPVRWPEIVVARPEVLAGALALCLSVLALVLPLQQWASSGVAYVALAFVLVALTSFVWRRRRPRSA